MRMLTNDTGDGISRRITHGQATHAEYWRDGLMFQRIRIDGLSTEWFVSQNRLFMQMGISGRWLIVSSPV